MTTTDARPAERMARPDEFWDGDVHAYIRSGPVRVPEGLRLHTGAEVDLDPVTHEVIRHSLWNTNVDHLRVITNLAVSPIAVELRDFQSCILTEDCELLYMGPCMQYMSGMLDLVTRYILEQKGSRIRPGDMWLCNDPIVAGTHQQDVAIVCPVFVDGELFCWVSNVMHQNDLGGTVPGSFCGNAEDVFWEPQCLPPIPIVRDDAVDPDIEALYRRCSRTPAALSLDLRAAVAGNTAARSRILELVGRYGKDVVKASMRRVLAGSASALAGLLATIPDGEWSERVLQEVARTGDRGVYPIHVTARKRGTELTFDNVGTHDQVGAINIGFAGWRGSILAVLNVMALSDQMGCIGGAARLCTFEPEPGTIFCPDWGAAVSPSGMYATELAISTATAVVAKMLLSSTDPAVRSRALVSQNSGWQVQFIAGANQRGDFYVGALAENMIGAGSATCGTDGEFADGLMWVPDGSGPNVEAYERNWPVLYLYRREHPGSGGAGRQRSGNGGEICFVPHGGQSVLAAYTHEGIPKAMGVFGGEPGPVGRAVLLRDTSVRALLASGRVPADLDEITGTSEVMPGKGLGGFIDDDCVLAWNWAAPGGYGDPLTRDPVLVAADVAAGAVTAEQAHATYGVVLGAGGTVDTDATVGDRAQRRHDRLRRGGAPRAELRPAVALPASAQVVGHAYHVDADTGRWRCFGCGEDLGSLSDGPRAGQLRLEHPLDDLPLPLRSMEGVAHFVDAEVVWREFVCPGCGVRLGAEIATPDQPPLEDVLLVTP